MVQRLSWRQAALAESPKALAEGFTALQVDLSSVVCACVSCACLLSLPLLLILVLLLHRTHSRRHSASMRKSRQSVCGSGGGSLYSRQRTRHCGWSWSSLVRTTNALFGAAQCIIHPHLHPALPLLEHHRCHHHRHQSLQHQAHRCSHCNL